MRLVEFWHAYTHNKKCDWSRACIFPNYVSLILFHPLFAHLSSLPGISARPSRPESAVVTETLVVWACYQCWCHWLGYCPRSPPPSVPSCADQPRACTGKACCCGSARSGAPAEGKRGRVREEKGKEKKSTDELLRWNKTASAGFLIGIQTWETPLVHGSLLRMFCLLAQAQCALMPNFSLSMCMAFTRSVKTATQHRKSLRVTFHIQEMCIRAVERRGGRAKRRSVGRGSVLLNSACAYTSKALNYAISALCQVCLELHNSPLFQTRRVPTMRKGMCLYGFSLRKEGSSWGIRLWSGDECVTLA